MLPPYYKGLNTLLSQVPFATGHGRMVEPGSRATLWRLGYNNPYEYADDGGMCADWEVRFSLGLS